MAYDKGNPINAPELVDPEPQNQGNDRTHPTPYGTQQWYPGEQQLPSHDQNSMSESAVTGMVLPSMMYSAFGGNRASETIDVSVSSNQDGPSNRPTPNSSSNTSEPQRSVNGTGSTANTNGTSFNTSPIGSHQNLGAQGTEMDASTASFFSDHGFSTGLTPGRSFAIPDTPGNGFSIPNSWEPGQAGMTPRTAEAIIHGLSMPMDSMEMNWDAAS